MTDYITKTARPTVRKATRPRCVKGCGKGRKGAKFCTRCGSAMPGTVVKAAMPPRVMPASFYAEPDPAAREMIWKATFGPMISKAR